MKHNMDAVMIVTHGLLNVLHTQEDCNVNNVESIWDPITIQIG